MSITYVSSARLRPYVDLCANEEDALNLHGEAMLMGSALLSVIALVEIALRNRLHSQIGKDFGEGNWLTVHPNSVPLHGSEENLRTKAVKQAQQDRYSKLSNQEKRQLDRVAYPQGLPTNIRHSTLSRRRQQSITIREGEVVAHTTIFFWKRFFAPEYEPTLWKRSVKRLFPNKTLERADVSKHIETLYRARNRLAHHEPMHGQRLEDAIQSLEFIRQNMDVRRPSNTGPLCIFTDFQHRNLLDKKAQFDDAWDKLSKKT